MPANKHWNGLQSRFLELLYCWSSASRKMAKLYNAASVIENGKIIATYHKQCLPNYSVFDEERYFDAGDTPLVFSHLAQNLAC